MLQERYLNDGREPTLCGLQVGLECARLDIGRVFDHVMRRVCR